jgi:hypothetical protein
MKQLIGTLILGGLLCTGLYAYSSANTIQPAPPVSIEEALQPASPNSIREVLRAHNIPQRLEDLSAFSAEAVRLTSRPRGIDREVPSFFERRISVVMAGNAYKRHMADPLRQREQFDLFDGNRPYHAVIENGQLAEEARQATESQASGVEFGVKTFGLAPILKQLSDPATEVVYVGRTAHGQDKFDVKTATDRWTLYADMEHLISRIESGDKAIEYAGYRFVEGVRLPLIQRLSIGGQLIQELVFTKIALNPKLPPGYFSREALTK